MADDMQVRYVQHTLTDDGQRALCTGQPWSPVEWVGDVVIQQCQACANILRMGGFAAGDPTDLVVAYCAPGLKGYATRLLESNGDRVREVIEHPHMAGRTDVILTTDPDWGRNHQQAGG